jgi:hypothetical protein
VVAEGAYAPTLQEELAQKKLSLIFCMLSLTLIFIYEFLFENIIWTKDNKLCVFCVVITRNLWSYVALFQNIKYNYYCGMLGKVWITTSVLKYMTPLTFYVFDSSSFMQIFWQTDKPTS